MTKETVSDLIKIYGKAWETADPELILTVFTPDAIYTDRWYQEPHRGHAGIKKYWQEKVIGEQRNIRFTPLNLYAYGEKAVSEWEAEFDDVNRNIHILMRGVLLLELEEEKIKSLREYWLSKK